MDDDATALTLNIVSITEDEFGVVEINHEGLDAMHALWLLESARYMLLDTYWRPDELDDED